MWSVRPLASPISRKSSSHIECLEGSAVRSTPQIGCEDSSLHPERHNQPQHLQHLRTDRGLLSNTPPKAVEQIHSEPANLSERWQTMA